MGNLFATILGVLAGVPFALEVSRRQQLESSAAAQADAIREQTLRKKKVLGLLRSEVQENLDGVLKRRAPLASGGKREVYTQSLKTQLWMAFSDGGELHHVNNPEVLARLADAYENIRHCAMLELKMLDAIHWPGMRIKQDKYPQDYLLEYLSAADPELIASMEKALLAIDAELTST